MKYSENIYKKALASLAALRETLSEEERYTVDFIAEAIAEKGDRDTGSSTNADRIRAMSDEELSDVVYGPCQIKGHGGCNEPDKGCRECTLDWLRQSADK